MLVLKDICFQYKKEIFKDANLRLNDSSLVCIHGKSGCGKTTLLKLLSFELPLQSGSISYMGNDINKDNLNNFLFQNVSYIDQEGLFLHNMTIFDHFEFYANLHNIAISTNIMNEYLQKVNLENIDLKKYPSYLSTGQRKRFLISLALMMNKSIMLLDEPTASLDTKNKELLLDVLKELSKTMLIICTSHDNQLIQKADSVYEIANLQFIEEKRGKSQENNFHVCKDKPSYIKYYKYKNLKIRFLFIVLFLVGVICINLISVSLSSNIALKAKINNQKASLQSNGLIYYKLPDARWLDFEEYDYIEPEDVAAIQKINGVQSVTPYYALGDYGNGENRSLNLMKSNGQSQKITYYWEKMSKVYGIDWYLKIAIFSYDPLQHIQINGKEIEGIYIDDGFADFLGGNIQGGESITFHFYLPVHYFETKSSATGMEEEIRKIDYKSEETPITLKINGVLPNSVYGDSNKSIDAANFVRIYMPIEDVKKLLQEHADIHTKHIYNHPMTYLVLCDEDKKDTVKMEIESLNELYRINYQNFNANVMIETSDSTQYIMIFICIILFLITILLSYYLLYLRKSEMLILRREGLNLELRRYYMRDYWNLSIMWVLLSIIVMCIYHYVTKGLLDFMTLSLIWSGTTVILIVSFALTAYYAISRIIRGMIRYDKFN